MTVMFFLAFLFTFIAIGVGIALSAGQKRHVDADITRFLLSMPPEAFEPDELWAAHRPPADLPPSPLPEVGGHQLPQRKNT